MRRDFFLIKKIFDGRGRKKKENVPDFLWHAGVDAVARITQLRDLLGQENGSLGRVAEDDG